MTSQNDIIELIKQLMDQTCLAEIIQAGISESEDPWEILKRTDALGQAVHIQAISEKRVLVLVLCQDGSAYIAAVEEIPDTEDAAWYTASLSTPKALWRFLHHEYLDADSEEVYSRIPQETRRGLMAILDKVAAACGEADALPEPTVPGACGHA